MSHRDGIREKRNIYKGIFFYVTKFSEALCRVQVNSVVHESVMFSNVIVDRTFPHRSFVFSQSSCEVSASRTDILTLKKSMADSLDNYYYHLGSERFGLWGPSLPGVFLISASSTIQWNDFIFANTCLANWAHWFVRPRF